MSSSNSGGVGPQKDLAQLLRLRKVRVEAAEAEVRQQRVACEKAEAAIQARHLSIEADRKQLERHAAYMVGEGAADIPRFAAYFSAYGSRLHDKLERNEYGLIEDQEDLEKSEALLRDKRQDWMREQAREGGVAEALRRSRKENNRLQDARAEDEVDELRRGGPLSASPSVTPRKES